jgi:tRNA (adenine37-N6)-methyltransferase
MTEHTISLRSIGVVRCSRREARDDGWDGEDARIELAGAFGPEALAGLDGFSHLEVIFHFDRAAADEIERGARHPRGRTDWPLVGIFAQRGKARPNRLGATICEILRVAGTVVHVRGLDAIDGTPVLDLKPVMKGFLPRGAVREPEWAAELMNRYW